MNTCDPVGGSRFLALGGYRPATVISNAELAQRLGVSEDWIRDRVGIRERHAAGPGESVVMMGAEAGRKALAAAGLPADAVDLILLATSSMPSPMPNGSAAIASALGIPAAGTLDVNAACAGFGYAVGIADGLIRSGLSRHALVIGSERMRDWVDQDDPATAVIFADGAGAAVLGAARTAGIGPVVWGGDGTRAGLIGIQDRAGTIRMQGPALFRWAITTLAPIARAACARAGTTPAQLKAFVPHQANLRITEALAEELDLPHAVIARDITSSGNTAAASIPLALLRLLEQGAISTGDPVLLLGFGAGLSYAAQVVHCP
ncbi:beta-ketoacyl-ACP synthase 3 [Crossiella sp. SN42]|uniref:beta-ketoacyl-ACP synthase 3 n=1 Tax=Crossiella sp. SN42 TaxID=2944808 RepID=UPI00207D083D|nr:beta-ketoacyl-ACP synthase 3 [Crossiella sp. SN42]MCO1580447.1 beta-ketoacyl-ACP synthase 3 [Crossiella sp. SN42]